MTKKTTKEKSRPNERVPVGIPNFDKLIEGGFKRNTTNLVAGGAGSGKTIFALQFLYDGITKYNENALYITFEEKKAGLYGDMKSLGWDFQKLEDEGKFHFLEYTPEQVKKLLVEGGGYVESIIQKHKIKRIVIDSITSFALLYQDELTRKEAALALIELINSWQCTALLTSEEEESNGIFISASLEFEVDSIMLLYNVKKQGERVRAMEILKMRGTKHLTKTIKFNLTNHGFELHPDEKVVF